MNNKDFKEILNGNKEILSQYLISYSKGFYKIAYAITGNYYDAEDAISSTTIKICEKIYTLQNASFFKTWATRILINECKDFLRKNSKVESIDESTSKSTDEIKYLSIAIRDIIKKLNETHQEIIILYYFDNYTVTEISRILDIPKGTVKSRLARARDELKKLNLEELL